MAFSSRGSTSHGKPAAMAMWSATWREGGGGGGGGEKKKGGRPEGSSKRNNKVR